MARFDESGMMRITQRSILILLLLLVVGNPIAQHAVAAEPEDDHHEAADEDDRHPLVKLLFPLAPNYALPPIQPNLQMFLASLVIFGSLVFLTQKHAWGPFIRGVNAREARVVNAERDAQLAREEVEKLRVESEARLAEVQDQVKAVIAQARSEAEAQKREIVASAEQESQRIKEEALRAIDEAQTAAIENLDQMVDDQVGLATEHVVGRRL